MRLCGVSRGKLLTYKIPPTHLKMYLNLCDIIVKLQVQGPNLKLTLLSHSNNKDNNKNNNKNPHLNFLKGTVLENEEQGVGMRDKGQGSKDKE